MDKNLGIAALLALGFASLSSYLIEKARKEGYIDGALRMAKVWNDARIEEQEKKKKEAEKTPE